MKQTPCTAVGAALFLISAILQTSSAAAQSWVWVEAIGGETADGLGEEINLVRVDAEGNLLVAGYPYGGIGAPAFEPEEVTFIDRTYSLPDAISLPVRPTSFRRTRPLTGPSQNSTRIRPPITCPLHSRRKAGAG